MLTRRRASSRLVAPALLAAACGRVSGAARTAPAPAAPPTEVGLLAGLTPQQRATLDALVIQVFQQAHPTLRLSVSEAPAAQVDPKLLTLVAGGTSPDVMFNAPPYLYLGGLTQEITDRVRRDRLPTGVYVKEAFDSAAVWRGPTVNVPYCYGGHSSVLPYNQALFQQAGIAEPPARWPCASAPRRYQCSSPSAPRTTTSATAS